MIYYIEMKQILILILILDKRLRIHTMQRC